MGAGVLCVLAVLVHALAATGEQPTGHVIEGRVLLPDVGSAQFAQSTELFLTLENGQRSKTFLPSTGSFALRDVPAGQHTLETLAAGLVFPAVKIEVQGQSGRVSAKYADVSVGHQLPYPLVLQPASVAEYFERRPPFSVLSFLKSPYGLMILFMAFSIYVLPKMRVDPDEYKEYMGQGSHDGSPARNPRLQSE